MGHLLRNVCRVCFEACSPINHRVILSPHFLCPVSLSSSKRCTSNTRQHLAIHARHNPICARHCESNMNLQLHVDHATKEWDDVFEFSKHWNVAVITRKGSAVLQRVMKYCGRIEIGSPAQCPNPPPSQRQSCSTAILVPLVPLFEVDCLIK